MVGVMEGLSTGGALEESQWEPIGEYPGDITDPFAKHTNRKLIGFGLDPNVVIPLPELGDVAAKDFRVWRSEKPGELIAFIRREAGEHKVVTSTILALGVVATAVGAVKYSKGK